MLLSKPRYHGSFLSFHQDAEYWDILPKNLVTAWIPLQNVSPENGCLRLIPGSHKNEYPHVVCWKKGKPLPFWLTSFLRKLVTAAGTGDSDRSGFSVLRRWKNLILGSLTKYVPFLSYLQVLEAQVPESELKLAIDIPMKAGSVVFFHGLLLHASHGNNTGQDRWAYIPTYLGGKFTFCGVGEIKCVRFSKNLKKELVLLQKYKK